jgi:L-seryl-tRNA(Ser) seleniumtransferase
VDRLLHDCADLVAQHGHIPVRDAIRVVLDSARQAIRNGIEPNPERLIDQIRAQLSTPPSLRPVINATGVILHTNLGRAPLSDDSLRAMMDVAAGYSTLEYNLEAGKRGKRDRHIESLIKTVTGADAALVVNNNAAAVTLILSALAANRDVLISRGQLVEIGGGFRMPDVMAQSGARMVEVGTTNRTHLRDFARAITPDTAMILRVHASNFKQIGFTSQPDLSELAGLAKKHGFYTVDDVGSGALLDTAMYGLAHEPTPQESLTAGFDVVAFSGDKLLGGPQAGIIIGRRDLIATIESHPLARAFRIDKLSLAALIATLEHYQRGEAVRKIPVWQMISASTESIRERAEHWAAQVGGSAASVIKAQSAVGGGSLPGATLPSYALALSVSDPQGFTAQLRRHAIIARIDEDHVLFDPRTVLQGQDEPLLEAVHLILSKTQRAGE